jgi:anti-sigma factor RsiW
MNEATADACQRYLEDPEANAGHLETCAECRAVNAALSANADVDAAPISLDSLPLAPWEGSSHRAWPLVLGAAAAVIIIAFVLCDLAGISPMHVAESSLASMEARRDIVRNATEWLRAAPAAMQVAFGVAFIVVNALLVVLLRRAPRGIDA